MNDDLISRSELKKDLKQYFTDGVLDGISARLAFNQILHDIDNAPTVELFCSYLSDGEVRQPCVEGPCEQERQQGEWMYNDYGNGCGNWHCSKCDHIPYYATKYMRFLNFCPNCGADMRGVTNV